MTAANLVERPALAGIVACLERLARLLAAGALTVNVARKYAGKAQRDTRESVSIGKLAVVP